MRYPHFHSSIPPSPSDAAFGGAFDFGRDDAEDGEVAVFMSGAEFHRNRAIGNGQSTGSAGIMVAGGAVAFSSPSAVPYDSYGSQLRFSDCVFEDNQVGHLAFAQL